MTTKIADLTKTSRWLKGRACKTVLGSALFVSASLLSGQALAYLDYGIVGLTTDPAEYAQIVSPSESIDFSTYTPGNYGGSQVFSGNGYTVTASSNTYDDLSAVNPTFTPSSSLTVIAPGRLSTQDPGKTLLFTADVGNPSGMGGSMRLVDATGQTTSGLAAFTLGLGNSQQTEFFSFAVAFDAITGFDFGSAIAGLPSSFFLGGFLKQAAYDSDPTVYYAGFGMTPVDVTGSGGSLSTTLYAAIDTANVGASSLFGAVPEIDALAGTSALSLIGLATLLAGERRRRRA